MRYRQLIDKMLERNRFEGVPSGLYEPANYLMDLGGKRLRPMLTLLACDMMGGDVQKAILPAIGLEVFHNFSLMHDDIMDNAPLRRGQPTVHEKWSTSTAILSGDRMLVKAYELMMRTEGLTRIKVLDLFNQTAAGVCEGQQMDMDFEQRSDVSVKEYIRMIELKTAVLLACCLKTGALVAETHESDADLLYDFGIYTGIGFQLMDDLLDVFGHQQEVGKQEAGDILSDKKTWLLLRAFELANEAQKKELNKWIGNSKARAADKIAAIRSIYTQLDIENLTRQEAAAYFHKADRLLEAVTIEKEKKDLLRQYTEQLKNRVA